MYMYYISKVKWNTCSYCIDISVVQSETWHWYSGWNICCLQWHWGIRSNVCICSLVNSSHIYRLQWPSFNIYIKRRLFKWTHTFFLLLIHLYEWEGHSFNVCVNMYRHLRLNKKANYNMTDSVTKANPEIC